MGDSDVSRDRMISRFLPPAEDAKTQAVAVFPPPTIRFTFERIIAGISRGYRYWLDYNLFSKI
jgi:hypothetical protein